MLEVRCACSGPIYTMDTGNEEDAANVLIRKIIPAYAERNDRTTNTNPIPATTLAESSNPRILKHFPQGHIPREIQEDLIQKIESKFASGYKIIVLSAPTGIGKSDIAAYFAKSLGSSHIVTSSKNLQDQYSRDLKFLKPVKGMSNFPCLQLMKNKKIDLKDDKLALQRKLTCELGSCKKTVLTNGTKAKEVCEFKPSISDVQNGLVDNKCHYYIQKYAGLVSNHTLWNYSSYFQLVKFQKEAYSDYIERAVGIFDESHKIEDEIIQFIGSDIYKRNLEECNIDIRNRTLSDIDVVIRILDDLAESYARQIKETEESRAFQMNPDYELLTKLEKKYKRFITAKIDISSNKDNFVVNDPVFDRDGEFRFISIKPLDISQYAKEFFDNSKQIFMSATIDKSSFCENIGFKQEEVAVVEAPKSPFSYENRAVDFLNIRSMRFDSTPQDELAVIQKIDELLSKHHNQRGLILTSSRSKCNKIYQNLSVHNKKRVRICHSNNEFGKTQDEIIAEHSKDPNGVLLSSSLWEGVDLKDDLSRFQIIAKTPFPDSTEKRVKEKMKKYYLWYRSQTITKLLQGFGRSIRSETDWARTYVLDTKAKELLKQNLTLVPLAYHDLIN